mgnify:CR=1 FL=1
MPRNDIQKQGRILMLPVDCIEPSPYQARTAFDCLLYTSDAADE